MKPSPQSGVITGAAGGMQSAHLETAVADGRDEALLRPQADGVAQRRADCPADAAELALELVPATSVHFKP